MGRELAVLLISVFAMAWGGLVFYLFRSNAGNGRRRNLAGWVTFGFLWPLVRGEGAGPLTGRALFGWMLVILLTVVILIAIVTGII